MREMTKSGDPMLRVRLPQAMVDQLKQTAKDNKRRPQDEFVKRLNHSFKNEAIFQQSQEGFLEQLRKIYGL